MFGAPVTPPPLSFLCTERDSGYEPVPPSKHSVLLYLLCGERWAVAGDEAAQRR